MVWVGINLLCRKPLVSVAGTLNSQRYISEMFLPEVIQRLSSAIFQHNNARPHVARNVQVFFTHLIELFPRHACSPDLSPIENVGSMLAQRKAQDTPDQLCNMWKPL
ncbi:transposable element Tcb1 transposase [Trichonephila clavipes]|nr:transposable element Tcb1 transposase [Trichonephila clavipes]